MRKILGLALLCPLLSPALGQAATAEELEQRVKQLENQLAVVADQTEETDRNQESQMKISGYTDVEYINSTKSTDNPGFRMHHMSLFFKKQISEQWRFFSEVEYEDGPFFEASKKLISTGDGKIFLEAVNFDFLWRPELSTRVGRFFTPAGIWSIDHYPPYVPTQERPLHIRNIFPQVTDGAALYGTVPVGGSFINYDVYTGNGHSNTPGKGDTNDAKAAGLRMAVILPVLDYLELGATAYNDRQKGGPVLLAGGLHAKAKVKDFAFQAEYADGRYDPTGPGTIYHRKGYYAQGLYNLQQWTLGLRHDYYDENNTTLTGADERRNSAFVNYHINKDVVLKLEHHLIDKKDTSTEHYYNKTIATIAINLGN